jgi:hypothetical protein
MHPDGSRGFQIRRPYAGCPDTPVLSAYLDGEVERPWSENLRVHVAQCSACRERLERLRWVQDLMKAAPEPDAASSLEKVHGKLLVAAEWQRPLSLWQRQVAFPMPVVAMAAVLFLFLGVSLLLSLSRPDVGLMSIKSAPSGGTEVQISASPRDLEKLLLSLEKVGGAEEEVIKLPSDKQFNRLSPPIFIKEKDLPERKTW